MQKENYIWGFLRLGLGLIFLWAFFDKLFGLGFATASDKSWLGGTSPTFGFLKFGAHGPFASFYNAIAGNIIVDLLFMGGLLFIGIALTFGILVRLGGSIGILMLFLMWTALLPPENHPFLDEHIIYILVIIGLILTDSGRYLGFGRLWSNLKIVRKYKILR